MIQHFDRSIVILCAGLGFACANGEQEQGWTSFGQTTVADDTTTTDDDTTDDDGDDEVGDSTDDDTTTTTTTTDDDTTTTNDDTTDSTTTAVDTGDECGNGVVDLGEDCDGLNFAGLSCMGLGFDGGFLICTDNCLIDSSNCMDDEDEGGGGGGQPDQGLYSDCLVPDDCVNADGCATVAMQDEVEPFDGYCTNFCGSDAECDLDLEGTAIPDCNTEIEPYCELICTGGLTCPAPMQCVQLADKMVCY